MSFTLDIVPDLVENLLTGNLEIRDLASLLLTEDAYKLQETMREIAHKKSLMNRVLTRAIQRNSGEFFSYERDINEPGSDNNDTHWSFIQNLSYDYPMLFADCDDNHDVADLLQKKGVLDKNSGDKDDPEMCCYYAYFTNKDAARAFIARLNMFAVQRLTRGDAYTLV
jgi:hypothetical protein